MSPGLCKRLPILVVVALGLWLWRSPLFPQPRTFIWDRPLGPPVTSAEVQLWRDGDLVSRAEWPDATRGTRVLTFARMGDGTTRQGVQTLSLESEAVVHAPLLPAVPEGHPLTAAEHGQ